MEAVYGFSVGVQAMDVSMQDADSPGRPTLQQMENAVMTLLEGVVPHNMLSVLLSPSLSTV